jgi:hypothetical protein
MFTEPWKMLPSFGPRLAQTYGLLGSKIPPAPFLRNCPLEWSMWKPILSFASACWISAWLRFLCSTKGQGDQAWIGESIFVHQKCYSSLWGLHTRQNWQNLPRNSLATQGNLFKSLWFLCFVYFSGHLNSFRLPLLCWFYPVRVGFPSQSVHFGDFCRLNPV